VSDPRPSERSLRWAVAVVAAGLAASLALVVWRELFPAWRDIQRRFWLEDAPGVVEIAAVTGMVDRCQTCHGGTGKSPGPPRCRAEEILHARHAEDRFGCSACHGGTGRALAPEAAHAMPGTLDRDPLLASPHLEASCGACHVPAERPGMRRLYAGAKKFLELGCLMCHPLSNEGRGGFDFGPNLRALGRRSLSNLRDALLEPAKNFADSSMPSFAFALKDDPAALDALLAFLQSLALPRPADGNARARPDGLLRLPCIACHAGDGGAAGGVFSHRCDYLRENAARLSCRSCHPGPMPRTSSGACPVLAQEGKNCQVCHDESPGGVR